MPSATKLIHSFGRHGLKVLCSYAGLVLVRIASAGPGISIRQTYHLPLLLALSMSERLSAFASDLLIERSFIPQLAG